MSNNDFPDDEFRREQEFIDGLYARVDALRGGTESAVADALAQGSTPMQARLERDILVAERSGLLAALNAVDGSLCFGRIDLTNGIHHHIGRIGIRADDTEHTPILIDWRAPVARPFYLATGHMPMGLRRQPAHHDRGPCRHRPARRDPRPGGPGAHRARGPER